MQNSSRRNTNSVSRADLYRLLCSFFLSQERTNQESELKGLMPLRNPQNLLLSAPAARDGYMARDAFQNFMSFSSIALVERQCQGSSKRERLG
jgi:hypothetical protein